MVQLASSALTQIFAQQIWLAFGHFFYSRFFLGDGWYLRYQDWRLNGDH